MMFRALPDSPQEIRALLQEKFSNPLAFPMSPRQRVVESIERRKPDRIPFDFWGVPETIAKMVKFLGASNEEEMLQLLGIDCRIVKPPYIGPLLEKLEDGSYYDAWGFRRRKVSNNFSTYEEYGGFPLADAKTSADVERWSKWPRAEYWDWKDIPRQIDELNRVAPYHMRYEVGGIFEFSWGVYGLDRFLVDLLDNPAVPCAIMDHYTDLFIANVRSLLDAAGGKIDMLYTYDDIAGQNGPLMSPKMWRQYIMPRHQRLNAAIKEYGVKIMYHSCGAVYKFIQPLIDELHIDVLNPLQPRAKDMDMQKIKQEFGGQVAFHGGIDLQQTLPYGTEEEVVQEVEERCRILGKGGGYICTSAHYIQADVPEKNIAAMYAASRQALP